MNRVMAKGKDCQSVAMGYGLDIAVSHYYGLNIAISQVTGTLCHCADALCIIAITLPVFSSCLEVTQLIA